MRPPSPPSVTEIDNLESSRKPISAAEFVDEKLKQFFEKEHAVTRANEAGDQKRTGQSYKIPDLYQKQYIDLIKGKLRDNFIKICGGDDKREPSEKNKEDIEDQLEIAKEIFDERNDNIRCWTNVKRQEYEIRRSELKPGQIKLDNLMTQMADNMPFGNEGGNYPKNRTGIVSNNIYGADETAVPFSPYSYIRSPYNYIFGSNQNHNIKSEIDKVKYRDNAVIHTLPASKNYRNIVFDTRLDILENINRNDNRLKVFLEEGRGDLTPEERAGIKTRSRAWNRISNNFEEIGEVAHKLTEWAGRGVLSSSKASDSKIYKDYLTRRNDMISKMLWKAGPNAQNHSFYLKVLEEVNKALEGSDDIMDQATFQKMQGLIAKEIKIEDSVLQAELKAFNEKLNDVNEDMLKGLDKHVKEDDRLWKYRCLQVFLLLTPLGAFSIAGQVFSYIDPLMELIGPLFDAGKSLGEGLGDMATSDVLGPLGKIAEAFRIDDGIELFFEETPIISDLCEIFDFATDNNLVQDALGAAGPLQFSPIALLAPAVLYSFFRADAEITQYQKVSAYQESQQKALDVIFKEFKKGQDVGFAKDKNGHLEIVNSDNYKHGKTYGIGERVNIFVDKRMEFLKQANLDAQLVNFVTDENNAGILKDLFNGIEFNIKNEVGNIAKQSMLQIFENGGKKKFSEILYDVNSDARKEALDRFLLFNAIKEQGKSSEENLAKFYEGRSPEGKIDLCNKSIKNLNEKFIIDSAIKLKLTTKEKIQEIGNEVIKNGLDSLKVKSQICGELEASLKEYDNKYLMNLAKTQVPNSQVNDPECKLLNNRSLFNQGGIKVGGK